LLIFSFINYLGYSLFYYKSSVNEIIYFPPNTSSRDISRKLEEASIINDRNIFFLFVQLIKIDKRIIKSGEYSFSAGERMLDVLRKMIIGNFYIRKVTIPEGLTNYQVDEILNGAVGLEAGKATATLLDEGYLMPDTYYYQYGNSKEMIMTKMYSTTINFLNAHKYRNKNPDILKSYKDILTLASIIIKESGKAEEMPIIASVYLNRLKKGMLLQADPTVVYGISNGTGNLGRQISKTDLKADSPYNTYLYSGLPKSPIASPSRDAILAALMPDNSDYIYFVADGKGGHKFSVSLKEHNKNVAEYRKLI
jgi:UPF0755 protein